MRAGLNWQFFLEGGERQAVFLDRTLSLHLVFVRRGVSGEAADGRSPSPLRSSGTFAIANGGFAALLMGGVRVGAGGGVLDFRAVLP